MLQLKFTNDVKVMLVDAECRGCSLSHGCYGLLLELSTNIREVFTITEKEGPY